MHRYLSSYRAVNLDEALKRARAAAPVLGVSRVTDITRLDRVGIPVFSSIRPTAAEGSLCVNAGKGLTVKEARVGALMEAIEYSCVETTNTSVKRTHAHAGSVLDGACEGRAILDLCPIAGAAIPLDTEIECVRATDLDGRQTLVPAELVFYPYRPPNAPIFFGSSTNGLASGSTLLEATIHGLFEVVERDIASFAYLGRRTVPVALDTLPQPHRSLVGDVNDYGFDLILRWLPNEYELACFRAILWERNSPDPFMISDGYGCHVDPVVALTRALTEAAQSRLTHIHGGRDDIKELRKAFAGWSVAQRRAYGRKLLARRKGGDDAFDFRRARSTAENYKSLERVFRHIRSVLALQGMHRILRIEFTDKSSPFAVVRVIVPKIENFQPEWPRMGPRLARFASHA